MRGPCRPPISRTARKRMAAMASVLIRPSLLGRQRSASSLSGVGGWYWLARTMSASYHRCGSRAWSRSSSRIPSQVSWLLARATVMCTLIVSSDRSTSGQVRSTTRTARSCRLRDNVHLLVFCRIVQRVPDSTRLYQFEHRLIECRVPPLGREGHPAYVAT